MITFPTLDMTALSGGISGFFTFMSPALWLIGGISVGGILLSRARSFF